jgi:hypothetical protein
MMQQKLLQAMDEEFMLGVVVEIRVRGDVEQRHAAPEREAATASHVEAVATAPIQHGSQQPAREQRP